MTVNSGAVRKALGNSDESMRVSELMTSGTRLSVGWVIVRDDQGAAEALEILSDSDLEDAPYHQAMRENVRIVKRPRSLCCLRSSCH